MTIKLLEIRDSATFIPVAAFRPDPYQAQSEAGAYLLQRAGFVPRTDCIFVIRLATGGAEYDEYNWAGSRTMCVAHGYIRINFNSLKDGDVVDVEFILGETKEVKISERLEQ